MKKVLIIAVLTLFPFVMPVYVRAQTPAPSAPEMADICKSTGGEKDKCVSCVTDGSHMWTAFGCMDANPSTIISSLIMFAIGLAGGIAFLLILFGGFSMMTSAGNPERLNSGRELVTAALSGLILIIFSIFILRLIGVNILGIPGFS